MTKASVASPSSARSNTRKSKTCLLISDISSVVEQHYGVFLEAVNENSKVLEKLFVKEHIEDFRYLLFLFWKLVLLFENRVLLPRRPLFASFYETFNDQFGGLKYEIEKSYNISSSSLYKVYLKVKSGDKHAKKQCFLQLSDQSLLIVQRSKNPELWAEVLVNIKYKLFKAKIMEDMKMQLYIIKQHKNITVYFEEENLNLKVFNQIQLNKREVLMKELTVFSERLMLLKELLSSYERPFKK